MFILKLCHIFKILLTSVRFYNYYCYICNYSKKVYLVPSKVLNITRIIATLVELLVFKQSYREKRMRSWR